MDADIYPAYAGGTAHNATHPSSAAMWWDEEKIESTVTRQFVLSHLLPDEQTRLDNALGFGDGLTDDTYMDWIDQRAKRLFLILVDLGVPDQIFGVIDDSWDDNDLPVPLDQVARLRLTYERDLKLERRFYQRQFAYLLKHLHHGDCLFYEADEVVPLEVVDKRPVVGLPHSNVDKVHLPDQPDDILLRRRIQLGIEAGQMPQEEFLAGISQKRAVEHKHLVTVWASYIHLDGGYILLTPVNDGTLKAFLTVTPPSIKILQKRDRRVLLLDWILCLAAALEFLHKQGLAHRKIKPSNVMMDINNNIFLNDSGLLTHHQATDSKKSFDKESYDYAAPEQWGERPTSSPTRMVQQPISPVSRHQSRNAPPPGTSRASVFSQQSYPPSTPSGASFSYDTEVMYTIPFHPSRPDPQKSDIFSLGCVFLDILTVLLKRPSRSFASHRSAKNKTPGRGGGLPDSSFHKNLGQVESWIAILAKDASKKEDRLFRGVSHILNLVTRMLALNPVDRPNAQLVRQRVSEILTRVSGIDQVCCGAKNETVLRPNMPLTHMGTQPQSPLPVIDGVRVPSNHRRSGSSADGNSNSDRSSLATTKSSASSANSPRVAPCEAKMSYGPVAGMGKLKAKAKAWQAPVYAEFSFG